MLEALITSKTRIKLLLKFFLNPSNTAYLRKLESELGDNNNSIRIELNKLEKAGLLKSYIKGNKKFFQSNIEHPLYTDINRILMKITGLDNLIREVLNKIGELHLVYLTGDLSKGKESEILDIVLIGDINREFLNVLICRAEKYMKKKIRYVIYNHEEFESIKDKIINETDLLLWNGLK